MCILNKIFAFLLLYMCIHICCDIIYTDFKNMGEYNVAQTEAQLKASKKYHEKFELIQFRVPKGKKQVLQEHAAQRGESLNGFLNRVVDQALSADDAKK